MPDKPVPTAADWRLLAAMFKDLGNSEGFLGEMVAAQLAGPCRDRAEKLENENGR